MSPESEKYLAECTTAALRKSMVMSLLGDERASYVQSQIDKAHYDIKEAGRLGCDPAHLS